MALSSILIIFNGELSVLWSLNEKIYFQYERCMFI